MVHILYAITAFTCALVVMILPIRTRHSLSASRPLDNAFLKLGAWTAFFCLSDCIWGVCASEKVMNGPLLAAASFCFHLFAAFTPLVWLQFVLTYIGKNRLNRIYLGVSLLLFIFEITLLGFNFKTHSVFSITEDGAYLSGPTRQYLFYAQYANYLVIAVLALFRIVVKKVRVQNLAVISFVAAPIASGFFQMLYPDAPAYSIGYMIGFCIIYSTVITEMLEARIIESAQMVKANKAKTTFLNNMSHDIRTPLNAITGFNHIAQDALGNDDDKVKDCLTKIGKASDVLLTIINDILEISRIEAGKITICEDSGNVEASFSNVEAMMQELAKTAGIDLEFSFGEIEDKYVIYDAAHCGRVFTNLISNAIKYTPRGGKVRVRCEQTGRRDDGYGIYTYTFADNGIGMSEEFQKHLFQAFARERSATVSKIQGTGLGLALSKNLVELMGGTVSCVSRQGAGSTFTVVLPFKIQDGQTANAEEEAQEVEVALDGRNILLVDDNEMNREIANFILTQMGASVTEAEDGSVAVAMMKGADAGKFDLILMDIQMPVLDGYSATRQIRALGTEASRIPIVAMTANAFEEDRQMAIASGMNGHIAKPIDIDALRTTLKQILEHPVQ